MFLLLPIQTLSDSDKRSQYDNFGTTSGNMGPERGRHGGFPHGFQAFDSFFSDGPFRSNFGGGESNLDKFRMTIRYVICSAKFKINC
jgi:DnaJ-class molecular chaperone